jgi:hypothetical protein
MPAERPGRLPTPSQPVGDDALVVLADRRDLQAAVVEALERHAIVECLIDAEVRQEVAQNPQQLPEQAVFGVPMSLHVRLERRQGDEVRHANRRPLPTERVTCVRAFGEIDQLAHGEARVAPAQIWAMSPATKRSRTDERRGDPHQWRSGRPGPPDRPG